MEIRKFVVSGKPQFGKYTKSVPKAVQPNPRVFPRTETEFNIRRQTCLPKDKKAGSEAVKKVIIKAQSKPLEFSLNMGLSQRSSQSQKEGFSGKKSKFTSSVSIVPRTNGLPKYFISESDGAKKLDK